MKASVEQHCHKIKRARLLIAFVRERPFMYPDWNRLARAAYAAGLFKANDFVDNAVTMKRIWEKRAYWDTPEAEQRFCGGVPIPLASRGHLL